MELHSICACASRRTVTIVLLHLLSFNIHDSSKVEYQSLRHTLYANAGKWYRSSRDHEKEKGYVCMQ